MPDTAPEQFQAGGKFTVRIDDIAFGGEGVARINQFVVFVPFVIVGEEVKIELVEVKKNFARARLVQIIQASPLRAQPGCPYFGVCGGCQYQHLAYPAQLEIKHKQVTDIMARIGKVPAHLVAPIVPCPKPYGYRNRIMVRSQWDKFRRALNIGFLRTDSRLVVDIEQCPISEPAVNEQLKSVRAHPPPKGGLKVVLRIVPEDWEVPADSFFQNNFHLLPKLLEVVRRSLGESGSRFLVDAYCGVGFFSLEFADLVEEFVGIEIDPNAVRAARRNGARKGRHNGQFIAARTEDVLPQFLARFPACSTTVVLDPPRTGCPKPVLELLAQLAPAQILCVSCYPATLARDLNVLGSAGVFELKKVVPLDMFPQTQHVECLADLRRKPEP